MSSRGNRKRARKQAEANAQDPFIAAMWRNFAGDMSLRADSTALTAFNRSLFGLRMANIAEQEAEALSVLASEGE